MSPTSGSGLEAETRRVRIGPAKFRARICFSFKALSGCCCVSVNENGYILSFEIEKTRQLYNSNVLYCRNSYAISLYFSFFYREKASFAQGKNVKMNDQVSSLNCFCLNMH